MKIVVTILRLLLALSRTGTERGVTVLKHAIVLMALGLLLQICWLFAGLA